MNASVLKLTDDNFAAEVLESDEPVLVDFWAPWCMPCKMLKPTLEQVASHYAGRIKVGIMDTDTNHDTTHRYGISAVPTLILFKDGQVQKKFVGLTGIDDLTAAMEAAVAG